MLVCPSGSGQLSKPRLLTVHYRFGGTNGFQWFNDVWCYDPAVNKWEQLDCIGYIPAPREGHAASLVDDVMYVFGGRTDAGSDLGDLAAFRISSRRWYTFQNMGPSPSPRSGHSMTTVGKSIIILGGEPSSSTSTINDLGIMYVLDTAKIRYPNDSQQSAQKAALAAGGRRPSGETANTAVRQLTSRDGPGGNALDSRKVSNAPPVAMSKLPNGYTSPTHATGAPDSASQQSPGAMSSVPASKLPRAASASPAGPPPTGPTPAKPSPDAGAAGKTRGPPVAVDREGPSAAPPTVLSQAPALATEAASAVGPVNGRRTPPQAPQQVARSAPSADQAAAGGVEAVKHKQRGHGLSQGSVDSATDSSLRGVRPTSPPPPLRQAPSHPLGRRSSGRNSQTVALLKELDSARNRNAWYASELELARKGGYVSASTMGPLDAKATETFDDEDRPLIEALLAMRTELANVQSAVDKQAVLAARQIAEAEKQRDAAIQEAVYAKAKVAAYSGASASSTPQLDGERDDHPQRDGEIGRKLASALHVQKALKTQVDSLRAELSVEKNARQLAEDTSGASEMRMSELEDYKQQTSTELEKLRSELHISQREGRDKSVLHADSIAAMELLRVERGEFESKYNDVVGSSKTHGETFESLRSAITASQDARSHLERKLEDERISREKAEEKLNKLRAEHEARTNELVSSTQRLRDAEELAEKHANEAQTHRAALLAGLDKVTTRDTSSPNSADAERIAALQKQVAAANELVKKYQEEANIAADKLRSAEERIAGLEQYQEQSSREGVSIRKQLQSALREAQTLQAGHSDLKNQLAAQQLETNAMTVQHNTLKDILAERGISPTGSGARSRGIASPRTMSPEQMRMRDLETQLAHATAAHEETKQSFASQQQESEGAYREKLSQLESDYQSAVHYVKGTEKMLKQLKDQLSRYKSDNGRLKAEVEELEGRLQQNGDRSGAGGPADWETERDVLHKKVEGLQAELKATGSKLEQSLQVLQHELEASQKQRDVAVERSQSATKSLDAQRTHLEQLQSENALLEQRAGDAEQKVALLLDQVEHSVDNYRRRSRQILGGVPEGGTNGLAAAVAGHIRNESSDHESLYGGNNNNMDARNSAALDNLASELETLRSHWEATNKNYRLSNNFEFDTPTGPAAQADERAASALDWRKRLDAEDQASK